MILADQWSKALVVRRMHVDGSCLNSCGSLDLIPRWLAVTPDPNHHGAFGFFGNSNLLLIVMAVIVLAIFWFSFRDLARRSRLVRVAFGLILGGAIGNVIDRVHWGYVIDFIDFYRYPHYWRYTFNIADSCITGGVILLLWSSLATRRHT